MPPEDLVRRFLFSSFYPGEAQRGSKSLLKPQRYLPGGPVVEAPPSNAGVAGSIPGQGTKIPSASWCSQKRAPQKALKDKAPETTLLPVLPSPASRSHVSRSFPPFCVSVLYSLWLTELVPPKDVLTPKNLDMYSLMWQEGLCRCN